MEVNPHFSKRAQEDYALVQRARAGDEKAFAALMKYYKTPIYHIILRMVHNTDDAEDLTIESLAKAFNHIEKYSPESAFSTWIYRIATNHSIDYLRAQKMRTLSLDLDMEDEEGDTMQRQVADGRPDPEEIMIRQQQAALMRDVVSQLEERYRNIVELRYFKELSYEEIAAHTGLTLGTVKTNLHRARALMYNIVKRLKDPLR